MPSHFRAICDAEAVLVRGRICGFCGSSTRAREVVCHTCPRGTGQTHGALCGVQPAARRSTRTSWRRRRRAPPGGDKPRAPLPILALTDMPGDTLPSRPERSSRAFSPAISRLLGDPSHGGAVAGCGQMGEGDICTDKKWLSPSSPLGAIAGMPSPRIASIGSGVSRF